MFLSVLKKKDRNSDKVKYSVEIKNFVPMFLSMFLRNREKIFHSNTFSPRSDNVERTNALLINGCNYSNYPKKIITPKKLIKPGVKGIL